MAWAALLRGEPLNSRRNAAQQPNQFKGAFQLWRVG